MKARVLVCALASLLGTAPTFGQAPPPPGDVRGCQAAGCHDAFQGLPVRHAPLEGDGCDACHVSTDEAKHAFDLTEKGAALCTQCHDAQTGKSVHTPYADGDCTVCHDPHASKSRALLIGDGEGALCASCHDDVTDDLKYLHGPLAAGTCTACHQPHVAPHASLLRVEGPGLCTGCHEALAERMAQARKTHAPVTESCTTCHHAHGGSHKLFLTAEGPGLCTDCHEEIGQRLAQAVTHDVAGTGSPCAACHDPHASAAEHLLLAEPQALCLGCHARELTTPSGAVSDIATHLRTHPNHHGALEQGGCTSCHEPHGSAQIRLLTGNYPAGFYSSFSEDAYGLCFQCHEAEAFADPTTDEATDFRNGTQNLHYLHVHRATKGRTCRACHDAHGSRGTSQIADFVRFGDWQLPINFRSSEAGGFCQPGCHRPYSYDRHTPVDNLPPPSSPGTQ